MKYLLYLWKKLSVFAPLQRFMLRQINDQFLLGVTGVIFNDKNQVLLVKHSYRKNSWSLPGGFLKYDERPKEGLKREIFEETGFIVEILKIITTKNATTSMDISYFGVYISGNFKKSEEVTEYEFVAVDALPKLITDQYYQIRKGLEKKKQYDLEKKWKTVMNVGKKILSIFLPDQPSNKNVQISTAQQKDTKAVIDIFIKTRAGMKYLPEIHTIDETKNYFSKLVKTGTVYVIKENKTITGFMQVEKGWLNHLYIAPQFHGQGFGKRLLKKAKELSPKELYLWVFEDNKGAIKFYEREGFRLEEKRDKTKSDNEEHLPDRKYSWSPKTVR